VTHDQLLDEAKAALVAIEKLGLRAAFTNRQEHELGVTFHSHCERRMMELVERVEKAEDYYRLSKVKCDKMGLRLVRIEEAARETLKWLDEEYSKLAKQTKDLRKFLTDVSDLEGRDRILMGKIETLRSALEREEG
jgi:monomeric isocitrate dehydrogenase